MKHSNFESITHTWNPWEGCTKVSPARLHCYAEHNSDTRWGRADWGPTGSRRQIQSSWHEPHKWHWDVINTGKKARVFCASLADVFDDHPSIEPEWRHHLWKTIRDTPLLDWLLLSKRPENFGKFLPEDWGDGYPNVCLMVTVENQAYAKRRIPTLLETPARRWGLSVEPLLGPVDLSEWVEYLDWVIVGGESLTGARPMNPNWVREIRDLCHVYGKPFLFKQWGWWTPEQMPKWKARHIFPDSEIMHYRGNTKLNGNILDDESHLAHPFRERLTGPEQCFAQKLLSGGDNAVEAA